MRERNQARIAGLAIVAAVVGLPLFGAWISGRELARLLAFPPPLAIPTHYPRLSGIAVGLVIAPFAVLAVTWLASRRYRTAGVDTSAAFAGVQSDDVKNRRGGPFPAWGAAAVVWTLGWWMLAWTRLGWFAPLQRYTFFPLWLGFIVSVNALTFARTGSCLMTRQPRRWATLFAASAAFWWVFEWLNRFVRNWHYLAIEDLGALAYAPHATLCFSTVLPAVAAVAELLGSSAAWRARLADGPRLTWFSSRAAGAALLCGGLAALVGTGAAPTQCYAALWAAPLALLLGESILSRRGELAAEIAGGDWRRAGTWAVAALVCGVFWELWNFHSAAKWIYTVPYVDRWHVFEMPILGYAGYLPFGLECYFVAVRTVGDDALVPFSRASSA